MIGSATLEYVMARMIPGNVREVPQGLRPRKWRGLICRFRMSAPLKSAPRKSDAPGSRVFRAKNLWREEVEIRRK
jgi:hypothetical protein